MHANGFALTILSLCGLHPAWLSPSPVSWVSRPSFWPSFFFLLPLPTHTRSPQNPSVCLGPQIFSLPPLGPPQKLASRPQAISGPPHTVVRLFSIVHLLPPFSRLTPPALVLLSSSRLDSPFVSRFLSLVSLHFAVFFQISALFLFVFGPSPSPSFSRPLPGNPLVSRTTSPFLLSPSIDASRQLLAPRTLSDLLHRWCQHLSASLGSITGRAF